MAVVLSFLLMCVCIFFNTLHAMETHLYLQNNSTAEYTLIASCQKLSIAPEGTNYVSLHDHIELYNTADEWHPECLKRKLPTLLMSHTIQAGAHGQKLRVITLEQKRPSVQLLHEITLPVTDTRDIECIIAAQVCLSKLHIISD